MLSRLERVRRVRWPVEFARLAERRGRGLALVADGWGAGPVNRALEVADARGEVEAVVSTGFCGALDETLAAGDIFVATRVRDAASGREFAARVPDSTRTYESGGMISSERVIQAVEDKVRLRATGAMAVDMEAAAVAGWAARRGVPFHCVRVVTDRADEGFVLDLNAARTPEGRLSRIRLLAAACRRPLGSFPELARLLFRSREAARRLGDFLADCEF